MFEGVWVLIISLIGMGGSHTHHVPDFESRYACEQAKLSYEMAWQDKGAVEYAELIVLCVKRDVKKPD